VKSFKYLLGDRA